MNNSLVVVKPHAVKHVRAIRESITQRNLRISNVRISDFYECNTNTVGGVEQWYNVGLWPANFPCPALDLQMMGDH